MLPGVLVLLLLAMVVGAALIVIALRGRRINNHPVCRQCHFDLEGTYPEVVTCPECGAGLKRDNAVRIGARKKLPLVAVLGFFLLLTPMLPVGAVAFAVLTGNDVNAYKPLGLLLWEAKRADAKAADKIADEILNRILSQKLSAAQYDTVINAVLAIQADTASPWHESWGGIIERAELDGTLKPAQASLFRKQAAVLELTSRPRTLAGAQLPIEVALKEARVGPTSAETAIVSLANATIDGKPVERLPEQQDADPFGGMGIRTQAMMFGGTQSNPETLGILSISGSQPRGRMVSALSGFDGTLALQLPPDIAPGQHTLSIDLDLQSNPYAMGGMTIINGVIQMPPNQAGETRRVTLNTTFEVLPDGEIVVPAVATSEEDKRALAATLEPDRVVLPTTARLVQTNGGLQRVEVSTGVTTLRFNTAKLPVDIAYDVIIRSNGVEQKIGELTTGKLATDAPRNAFMTSSVSITMSVNGVTTTSGGDSRDVKAVSGECDLGDVQSCDVILRPSAKLAASTINLTDYSDAELVWSNVPIQYGGGSFMDPFSSDPFRGMERIRREQQETVRRLQQQMQQRTPRPRTRPTPAATATPEENTHTPQQDATPSDDPNAPL